MNKILTLPIPVSEHSLTATIEVDYTVGIDRHYGADIDGNRGVTMYSITVDSIKIYDKRTNDITVKYAIKHNANFKKLVDEIEEKLKLDFSLWDIEE